VGAERVVIAEVRNRRARKNDAAMDQRSTPVQGKFIGTLARSHVICLAAHWSPGRIALPLQSAQLDKRAGGLSNLQQPGPASQPSFVFQMKFTISIMDLSQYGQSGFSWQIQAYGGLKLLKEKQAIIWQAAIVV